MHRTCDSSETAMQHLNVHSLLGGTQNPASFGNIFFLFTRNQLHPEKILPFIYTHVGVKPPHFCRDVKS